MRKYDNYDDEIKKWNIAKNVVEYSGVPRMNADNSRSVISTIIEHSRTKRQTRQDWKAIHLHDYRKDQQVEISSA